MSHFHRCIDFILIEEGGLVDHPQDPGGLTKHGISQHSYPRLDIRHLTRDGAKTIYRRDDWRPPPFAFCLHDVHQQGRK